MVKSSTKKLVNVIIATVISGLLLIFPTLYFTDIWKRKSPPDKVEVTNVPKFNDTLLVREVGDDKDTIVKIKTIPITIIEKPKGDAVEEKSNISNDQILPQKKEIANVVNNGMTARFAVLAVTNGRRDNQLASVFVDWLKNQGTVSSQVLSNLFIDKGFFKLILEGETNVVLNTNASSGADYICLIKSIVDFSQESSIEGMKFANCLYDFIIVDTKSGKIIDSDFNHLENSTDISEYKAKVRTETFLLKYLRKRDLNF